ncbi:GSCFA domain-containing protein [Chryseobacterium sp.]|uniref:GSCFA domain-containing protein n=1 Tax=Chryseobacterium sp. TaxID=1871047 RepID=UPI0012AA8725|nr:GSCFA domain-containing protein [Chryseobacterium sp.]QFG53929.1 GSCFA domain-containing protein [Chryseobacterium sp.]
MKFRTEVNIKDSTVKIEPEDRIFAIGSCFSEEISALLATGQLQTLSNPFGTIFNPYSIKTAVQRLHDSAFYDQEDLVAYDDQVISLDHHTKFNSRYAHQTLELINHGIEEANLFLQNTKWVIITYGTSFVYEFLPKNKLVANCHKIPGKFFKKRLLTNLELADAMYETVTHLKDICPEGVQILFTVSPVRHTRDGMEENTLSKAKLITAVHEVTEQFDDCHYLPAYEILMDDLRDYRFYKDDLIHPSNRAVQYIWEKFGSAYFSDQTMDFVEENFRISRALAHRPSDETDPRYQDFLENLKGRIALQQTVVKHTVFSDAFPQQ